MISESLNAKLDIRMDGQSDLCDIEHVSEQVNDAVKREENVSKISKGQNSDGYTSVMA